MYIQLMHRHYGIHEPVKHLELPCNFSDVYKGEDNIDEDVLLSLIPNEWLPANPDSVLLCVADTENLGTTGQRGLKRFRNWAKYFDSYVLDLHENPLDWWAE